MNFIISKKFAPEGLILVITDKDIVGKLFEEGNKQLDLTKNFYLGDERDAEAVKSLIPEAHILHLTGEKAVALGIELDYVDKDKVVWISGIPHAEALL